MNELMINLRAEQKVPLYEQIYDYIKDDIKKGRIQSGEKLPSTRALSAHLEVSRSTVELAYEQLLSEGYIEAQPYRGYFVCQIDGLFQIDAQENNKRENIWKFFYKTGDIKTTVTYKNGLKNGKVTIYDKGGGIVLTSLFENGDEIDNNGNIIEKNQPFKDGIVERFKKFNRNLKFEKYDKLLSEL